MALGRFIRCLLCHGVDSVPLVNELPAASTPSNAQAVALVPPQAMPPAILLPDTEKTTPLPPSFHAERVLRNIEEATPLPPVSSHWTGHIQEANVNHVRGDYVDNRRMTYTHSNLDPERDSGVENRRFLDDLKRESALGAIANAEERAYAPRCLHETRAKVLNDLEEWSAGKGQWKDTKLLVLTGPAGHGKTAIVQSFSEQLLEKSQETHIVVATFFFKVAIPDQNQPKVLVTTLAHQVAEHCPPIRRQIISVIRDNVRIFSTSLENQMKDLLVNPITGSHAATPDGPSFTLICAVDGLDECEGDDAQSRVIRLLHTLSTPNTRIVLASRPEFPIESAIKGGMSGTLHIDLNKDYNASGDIHRFTWVKLLEIRDRLLPSIDRISWPRQADAKRIADYASGQFILAETAMRYVNDRRYDPRKRLEEVLSLCGGKRSAAASPASTHPLGALDTLFTGILERAVRNAYPDMEVKQGILELASLVWILIKLVPSKKSGFLSFHDDPSKNMPLWVIEEALGLPTGGLARALSDLHSLLEVPEEMYGCKDICAHHKSLVDFLGDPQRSGHLGSIPERARSRFDEMIASDLRRVTENDLKCLITAQDTKPHILHYLHFLCEPKAVLAGVDAGIWKTLLSSLNTWEALCLRDWVFAGLRVGPSEWTYETGCAMEAARDESWRSIIPGISDDGPQDPHSVSHMDLEELRLRLDDEESSMLKREAFAYIPTKRATLNNVGHITGSFPWLSMARVLAFLWEPKHRLTSNRDVVQHIDSQFVGASNPRTLWGSRVVFIIGSPGSGKRELLRETYSIPSQGRGDNDWACPPVDIIIVPDGDHLSLKSLWTTGSLEAAGWSANLPCKNEELMGNIKLSRQTTMSLFRHWAKCWKDKDKRNTHHPQFLLQGLHLLSPEHQGILLNIISSEVQLARSTTGLPFFITVTSLPTEELANKLQLLSGPGVYYVNLDAMKADVAVVEGILLRWAEVPNFPLSPLKLSKLARISARSPRPVHHTTKLVLLFRRSCWSGSQLENRLDSILTAPEPEAWRLIDEHLGDIDTESESSESEDQSNEDDETTTKRVTTTNTRNEAMRQGSIGC